METQEKIGKEFYYPVKKVASKDLLPENSFLTTNEYAVTVETPSGTLINRFCAGSTNIIPSSDLFSTFESIVKKNFSKVEISYAQYNVDKFYATYIIKDVELAIYTGTDIVYPFFQVQNSYSGAVTPKALFAIWRQICGNGLWGLAFDESTAKYFHYVRNLEEIKKVAEMFCQDFKANFTNLTETYQKLGKKEVEEDNLLQFITDTSETTNLLKTKVEDIESIVRTEAKKLGLTIFTYWLIYNAFNYEINHTVQAKVDQKANMDRRVFEHLMTH